MAYTLSYTARLRTFADRAQAETTRKSIKESSDEMAIENISKRDTLDDAVDTIYYRLAVITSDLNQLIFE